jgi:hypothetical protein
MSVFRDAPASRHCFCAEYGYIDLDYIVEMWAMQDDKWTITLRDSRQPTVRVALATGRKVLAALKAYRGQP